MDIGSMRQRIILQKHILHTDEIGNHQSQWEKFYSCFAYVNLASGKENVTDIETLSEDTLVFILRWCEKLREINKNNIGFCLKMRFITSFVWMMCSLRIKN